MFEDLFNIDTKILEKEALNRGKCIVKFALDDIVNEIRDHAGVIGRIFASEEKEATKKDYAMELITGHIEDAAKGKLRVVDYNPMLKSNQTVYLFLGTHWKSVACPAFSTFVRECVKKMGLPSLQNANDRFMDPLSQRLQYRISRYMYDNIPVGDVWVNLKNCTLEIHGDGSLTKREHNPEDFLRYAIPYSYDEKAECPMWHDFLDKVMPEKEMQQLLAEYIGYCFTKDMNMEKMAVFYGTGSNGKSVCLDVIRELFGKENVSVESLSAITMDDEKRGQIEDKLANISSESDGKLDFAKLKQMVSGEPITIRELYKGTRKMDNYAKFFTSFNTLPSTEYTYGYFRRWLLFPFSVTIPDEEQDINLAKKLRSELPGILNWVLDALKGLIERQSFTVSQKCTEALNDYKRTSNSAAIFFHDRCLTSKTESTKLNDLYNAYSNYCRDENLTRLGKKRFQEVLKNDNKVSVHKYGNFIMYNIVLSDNEQGY